MIWDEEASFRAVLRIHRCVAAMSCFIVRRELRVRGRMTLPLDKQ